MKTLRLLRHAKSRWDEPGFSDIERGLNKRGQREAPMMGSALAGRLSPQGIWVSPAQRAQLTLAGVCQGWPSLGERHHVTDAALYTFSSRDLLHWLNDLDPVLNSCFLIGHNPAMTDLVNTLCGEHILDNLPTAGFAQLSLDIEQWRDLAPGCATLDWLLFPKELRNGHPPDPPNSSGIAGTISSS